MSDPTLERRISAGLASRAARPSGGLFGDVMTEVAGTAQRHARLRWPSFGVSRRALLLVVAVLLLAAAAGAVALSRLPPPWPFADARWTAVHLPFSGDGVWRASPTRIIAFRGTYVAVGARPGVDGWGTPDDLGLIWHSSPDGTWHAVDAPEMAGSDVLGVATNGSQLVAVGVHASGSGADRALHGVTWISTDGDAWEAIDNAPSPFTGPVVFGGGTFVAMAGGIPTEQCSCVPWTSVDGREWRAAPLVDSSIVGLRATSLGVVAFGGGNKMPGQYGVSYVSTDGATWRRAAADQPSLLNLSITQVESADDGLIGVGWYDTTVLTKPFGTYALRSADGLTWTLGERLSDDPEILPVGIQRTPDGYAVVMNTRDGATVLGSRDGAAWSRIATIPILEDDGRTVSDWLVDASGQLVVVGESTHGPLVWTSRSGASP